MKPQDLVFLIVFIFLVVKRDSKLAIILGLGALFLSIPLFATWTFFTAERLTWYAAALFLLAIIFQIRQVKKNE